MLSGNSYLATQRTFWKRPKVRLPGGDLAQIESSRIGINHVLAIGRDDRISYGRFRRVRGDSLLNNRMGSGTKDPIESAGYAIDEKSGHQSTRCRSDKTGSEESFTVSGVFWFSLFHD